MSECFIQTKSPCRPCFSLRSAGAAFLLVDSFLFFLRFSDFFGFFACFGLFLAVGGFFILGAMMVSLDLQQSAEFYDVYRGVVDEFTDMVKELSSGLCLALEVAKDDGDVVNDLRDLCGPRDVPIAKAIEPTSIRARYGVDLVKNAVHCTDLADDAQLECEYFFRLLDQQI